MVHPLYVAFFVEVVGRFCCGLPSNGILVADVDMGTIIVALLFEALKGGLALLDPLFDDLLVQVDKNESHIHIASRLRFFRLLKELLEIGDLPLYFHFTLL